MNYRPYAERLAKAMPERFNFAWGDAGAWKIEYGKRDGWMLVEYVADNSTPQHFWAFFGPLWDELNPTYFGHGETWLERVADAVCQAAEAKAKGADETHSCD